MFYRCVRVAVAFLTAASAALSFAIAQPATASAASSGTLFAVFGGSQVVKLDPTTGSHTTIADFTVPTFPGVSLGDMASDAAGHRLFAQLATQSFPPPPLPPTTTYQLVTVSTNGAPSTMTSTQEDRLDLAWDPSSHTLFGLTASSPFQIVKVDPATGAEMPFATLTGTRFSSVALAPAAHAIYLASITFGPCPPCGPPAEQLLSVDTVTGAVTAGPNLGTGVVTLAVDSANGALFARTFCCPVRIVKIDPTTGSEPFVGSSDLGFGGNSLTVDPQSHTLYSMEDELGLFGFNQFVAAINPQTGVITLSTAIPLVRYISSLVFEGVAITPDSIISDVEGAVASGAIDNAGVGTALVAELNAAKAARARRECGAAANIYQAFINDLTAQSGHHVAAATVSQLISEAKFLIANCP